LRGRREDRINGHCETCAAALSECVLAELRAGTPANLALAAGTTTLVDALKRGTTKEQVALLFKPEARRRIAQPPTTRSMWDPMLKPVQEVLPTAPSPDWLTMLLAGATAELPGLLSKMAEHPGAAEDQFAVPLYVLNYICKPR
jgi:hypothetical protein